MKRRVLSSISLICAVMLMASALFSCTRLASTKKEKETVLKVGEFEVPFELYRYIALNFRDDCPDNTEEELKKKTEEALLDIYTYLAVAKDYNMTTEDDYFKDIADRASEMAVEEAGGKAEYKKKLAESHMNDAVFRFLTTKDNIKNELLYAMINAGDIDDSEDNIRKMYNSGGFICVKQVLIKGENNRGGEEYYFSKGEEHTDEQAEKIAEEVRKKALGGEDFDALIRDFGESLGMMQNTDGIYVCRGMWEKSNEDAVFALGVGEISEVVKSSAGYSVFLRCENSPAYLENGLTDLRDNYCGAIFALKAEEKRAGLTIEYTDQYKNAEILSPEFDK